MDLEKITTAELEVLKVLWEHNALKAKDIIHFLSEMKWSEKTIRTLLHRLVMKEIVKIDKSGKEYVYHSQVTKKEYTEYTRQELADRLFRGSTSDMLLNFLGNAALSQEEVKQLKAYLERYD